MEINTLPICGSIPTSYELEPVRRKSDDKIEQDLYDFVFDCEPTQHISNFPRGNVDYNELIPRESERPLTLQEFYQRVNGASQDSRLFMVWYDTYAGKYWPCMRELPFMLDYDPDKNSLEFASAEPNDCEFTNAKIIEYSQIASAIGNNGEGEVYMLRRQNVRQIPVPGDTPMYINTVFYGLRQIDNIVTFTGHKGISNEQQSYIGLVIYD